MSTKPDAWMPLYVADWDASTRHLDCEQDGAYGRLIRYYWKNGAPPDDDAQLARITGLALPRWRKMRPVIVSFFRVVGGAWTHKRVEEELKGATERRAKAAERARAAAEKRWRGHAPGNAPSMLQALLEECPSPSPTIARGSTRPLAHSGRRSPTSEPEGSPPPAWQGPQDIRDLCVSKHGEDFTRSWLDVCGWQDVPEPMILAPGQLYADRLWRALRRELTDRGVSIGRKAA